MLVYEQDELLAAWIGWQLGFTFAPPYVCIGVVRGDELLAACLYNNFQLPNIQMTIASTSPRWASREVIGKMFAYPFRQLGCRRVTAITKAMNQPARAFLCRLGFLPEGFHPQLFADDDGVSYGLLQEDARKWLEGFHESTERSPTDQPLCQQRGADPEQHRDGAG